MLRRPAFHAIRVFMILLQLGCVALAFQGHAQSPAGREAPVCESPEDDCCPSPCPAERGTGDCTFCGSLCACAPVLSPMIHAPVSPVTVLAPTGDVSASTVDASKTDVPFRIYTPPRSFIR